MQFAVAHYQTATNFNVHTINGNSGQRIESFLIMIVSAASHRKS